MWATSESLDKAEAGLEVLAARTGNRTRPRALEGKLMPTEFKLSNHFVGFAGSAGKGGGSVEVVYREYLAPTDPTLLERLENFQRTVFRAIPDLPRASLIDHLLVVIHPDLTAVAYVNELSVKAEVTPNRPIKAGEAIRVTDIEDISSVDLGIEIPEEAAFILVRSFGWRRSVIYDFGPLQADPVPRDYPLERALAEQQLLLIGLATIDAEAGVTRLDHMQAGLEKLDQLLAGGVTDEAEYQKLLEEHPWMLGGVYDRIERHTKLDDTRIPDFTGRRSSDLNHDVIEIKQPFLPLFKQTGRLGSNFNDAWNQAEGYLAFAQRCRTYLRDEKGIAFENPQGFLLVGHGLTEDQRKVIREKESVSLFMNVLTYDELRRTAQHLIELVRKASEESVPEGVVH